MIKTAECEKNFICRDGMIFKPRVAGGLCFHNANISEQQLSKLSTFCTLVFRIPNERVPIKRF